MITTLTVCEIMCDACGEPFTSADWGVEHFATPGDAVNTACDHDWWAVGDKHYCGCPKSPHRKLDDD